ncbi:UNVERIFIED_CONTAM: hypothetical protein H355_008580 [Colinus virginianus]|nr:hypothetical protein H355_008580 [Colinus virginianus]
MLLSGRDAFSTAGTVQDNLGIRPSRTRVRIRHPRVQRRWSPRQSAVLEEISDGNDGAAGTARDMQDAKDTAVTDEGVQDLRDSAVTEDADPRHEVSAEAGGGARSSECFRDVPEDGPDPSKATLFSLPVLQPAAWNLECSWQYQATRRPPGNTCNIGPGAGNQGC